ncbi:MAG: sensor histidine kinase, partial [Bacteroidales bacterium]
MGYNRFYFRLFIHVILIALFSLSIVYFGFVREQLTTSVLFLLFLAIILGSLIYYLNRTNRVLGMYFTWLNENDPTLAWSSDYIERNFKGFRSSLQGIMEQLKKARIEKEVQARYLENIIDNLDTGIITTDSRGKVGQINRAARNFLGIVSIHKINELDRVYPNLGNDLQELLPGRSLLKKVIVSGRYYLLSFRSSRIKNLGEEYRIFTIQDISTEMEEKEISSWKRLIRVINHEIMNSITPVTTLTHAIKKKLKATDTQDIREKNIDEALKSVEIIEDRAEGLIHFIEKYKKITKLPPLKLSECEIQPLFDRVERLFEEELKHKNIEWKTEIFQLGKITADPQLIEQVMINLVKNAMEALVNVSHPKITLTALNGIGGRPVITVKDNGSGIPAKNLEEIFVPFFTTRPE